MFVGRYEYDSGGGSCSSSAHRPQSTIGRNHMACWTVRLATIVYDFTLK